MKFLLFSPFLLITLLVNCSDSGILYQTDTLSIKQLTDHTYIHTSYLSTESFGNVPCNGLIYLYNDEAIVFDTPTNNEVSNELITWISQEKKHQIKAVFASHWHTDCLGGLDAFHKKGIPSYANNLTISLAKAAKNTVPQNGFDQQLKMKIGGQEIDTRFLGEGHTLDNTVNYIASERVLFGGCLIKALQAKEGYTADGDKNKWSNTVEVVNQKFNDVKYVVPGHGQTGGSELLDYTIELFDQYRK